LYTQGIAPNRTLLQAGLTNAYSSTFLIKSRGTGGKTVSRILTLTDLPGELLCAYGKLRVTDIYNNFAVATACDTFVVCLDTSTVEKAADGTLSTAIIQDSSGNAVKRTPSEVVSDTCIWADEFQKMLIQTGNKTKYVPMILLFTKCHQMENDIAAEDSRTPKTFDPLKKAYLLRSEQLRIEQNRFYDIACREFNSTGGLSNAYHAMLRCSPYGYKAPDPDEVLKGAEPHPPKPKHIDKLMQWILTVAGCVPMTAAYSADVNDVSRLERLVYVERPQHRQENPMKGSEVEEALLRCSLFVNPGKYDREFLKFANQKSVLFAKKLLAKADSNAE